MRWQYLPLIFATGLNAFNRGYPDQVLPRSAVAMSDACDCTGTHDDGTAGIGYICHDRRLGPSCLPRTWPLLSFVSDYDRFGGLTPGKFLANWTWPPGTKYAGKYRYPDYNGFQLNDDTTPLKPIVANMTLMAGTLVDRFGNETNGTFLSTADTPYSQRSLPPASLDNPSMGSSEYPNNYHVYKVLKDLKVEGGPIAPWFGQPGLGTQFNTKHTGDIAYLLNNTYLERVTLSSIIIGPGKGGSCGL